MFAAFIEDLAGASTADLDAALAVAKAKRDEADMEIAAITAVVDSRQLFQDHGHRSVNGYLKQQLNCSAVEAGRIRARARLVNEHPEIGDALGKSRISAEAATLLANAYGHRRAGDRFGEFAAMLTDHAERLEHSDFTIAVKQFINQADADGAFNDQEFNDDQRTASVRVDSGAVNVHAFGGDPIRAAEMKSIFDRAVDSEAHKDFETRRRERGDDALAFPLPRSADQRRFDAMHEIFMASVTAPPEGKRPEPLVNLLVDVNTGIEGLARHGFLDIDNTGLDSVDPSAGRCQTSTGIPVHPDVAVKAMLRGSVRRVVVDAHDVVINLGRTQRLFTGKAREAAKLLVVTCGHRGCDVPAEFCDVDHVDEWVADDGGTDQANALPLCGVHDRWKHRQRLRGRRDKHGRIHLVKPDGTVIKPLGTRDPVWAASDETGDGTSQPSGPMWPSRILTWVEWVADSPRNAALPDPGWTITITDLRAA